MNNEPIVVGREIGGIKYTLIKANDPEVLGVERTKYSDIGYIIISAYKHGDSAAAQGEINESQNMILKKRIQDSKFFHTPLWGGVTENGSDLVTRERAFIVFNFKDRFLMENFETTDELLSVGKALTKEFDQKVFFHKSNGANSNIDVYNALGEVIQRLTCGKTLDIAETFFQMLIPEENSKNSYYLKDSFYVALAPIPGKHLLCYYYKLRRETFFLSPDDKYPPRSE